MERQNYINSLLTKAENYRLLAHGRNAIELHRENINSLAYSDKSMMIEAMYKDHLACIDNLSMELIDFEERFDNSQQDEVD